MFPTDNGSTYNYLTLQGCKSNMHLVENVLWILIPPQAVGVRYDPLSWHWAGQRGDVAPLETNASVLSPCMGPGEAVLFAHLVRFIRCIPTLQWGNTPINTTVNQECLQKLRQSSRHHTHLGIILHQRHSLVSSADTTGSGVKSLLQLLAWSPQSSNLNLSHQFLL